MASKSSIRRLKFCNFKLSSLLEITNAINDNLSVEKILSTFEHILLQELNIGKVVVYAFSKTWKIMLESGAKNKEFANIIVEEDLLKHEEITTTPSTDNLKLSSYDFIIPVFHDTKPIAYVLIGDVEEEKEGVSPTIKHLHFIQTLTNVIFVAVENKRLYEENLQQARLKKEMELASRMQNMLIPDTSLFPKNEAIFVDSFYLPHFDVGGDYYDFERLSENEYFFCVADVSGKGISAALLMSNFQASLKAYLTTGLKLPELINLLNGRVVESAQGEKFITIFVGKYNSETRELRYINAGHNPPLLFDKVTEKIVELKDGCPGIGMLDEIPFMNEGVKILPNPTKLICFTDGLTELENENKEEIGLVELKKCMTNQLTVDKNFLCLQKNLNLKKGNPALFDDITILGIDFL
ncbi:MAG: PP2C family protein-serine/threonine phosphatase [Bacteroidales bacterium]|nr:PP2C family protein-serine/threonine phosphatase [Bacteroidales bacterium]